MGANGHGRLRTEVVGVPDVYGRQRTSTDAAHLLCKQGVVRSIPISSTEISRLFARLGHALHRQGAQQNRGKINLIFPAFSRTGCWVRSCGLGVAVLVFDGCEHVDGAVSALSVVEDLEALEDRVGELDPGLP